MKMLVKNCLYKAIFVCFLCLASKGYADKQILGLIEQVKLYPYGLVLDAKLDTGADSCSLHASDIKEFTKDGNKWVKFTIEDRYGKKVNWESEVARSVRIKRLHGNSQVRKTIRVGLCLGGVYKMSELTLVDRGNFNYQMLVGKRYLSGDFVVDPAVTYTMDPKCKVDTK